MSSGRISCGGSYLFNNFLTQASSLSCTQVVTTSLNDITLRKFRQTHRKRTVYCVANRTEEFRQQPLETHRNVSRINNECFRKERKFNMPRSFHKQNRLRDRRLRPQRFLDRKLEEAGPCGMFVICSQVQRRRA
jgi:hypothetical protein